MPDDSQYLEDLLAGLEGELIAWITSKSEWLASGISNWGAHIVGTNYEQEIYTQTQIEHNDTLLNDHITEIHDKLTEQVIDSQITIQDGLRFYYNLLNNTVSKYNSQIQNSIESAKTSTQGIISNALDTVEDGLAAIGRQVSNTVGGITNTITDMIDTGISTLNGWLTDLWGEYYALWKAVAEVIIGVPEWIDTLKKWFDALGNMDQEDFTQQVLTIQKKLLGVS